MKVLHLISSGGMYGAEAVILNLSAELNRGERDTSCLGVFSHIPGQTPALHGAALLSGIRSVLVPCRGQLDLSVAGKIRKLVAETGAHVVHAHGYKADIYSFLAFRGGGRPSLVSTCHTWYDNDLAVRLYGAGDRWVLRYFDQVIAVSPEVEQRLRRSGVAARKVRLIRNGIEAQRFAPVARERVYRPLGAAPLRVGLVGRLAPEKGVDLFLRAAAQVAARLPQVEFVVAGDGPDRPQLENLLHELGLEHRAHLVGQQGDMAAFYGSLDLLVSASRQEGLPMALLEGMATGLPLIATAVGAVPSLVVDGVSGLLVQSGSPEAMSAAIVALLADAAERERLGRGATERVMAEFSAQRMAAEYAEVYRHAVAERSVPAKSARQSET